MFEGLQATESVLRARRARLDQFPNGEIPESAAWQHRRRSPPLRTGSGGSLALPSAARLPPRRAANNSEIAGTGQRN